MAEQVCVDFRLEFFSFGIRRMYSKPKTAAQRSSRLKALSKSAFPDSLVYNFVSLKFAQTIELSSDFLTKSGTSREVHRYGNRTFKAPDAVS